MIPETLTLNQMLPLTADNTDYVNFIAAFLSAENQEKMRTTFGGDYVQSLSWNFRVQNGDRRISEELRKSLIFQLLTGETGIFTDLEMFNEWAVNTFNDLQYKWSKLIENVYAQSYEPLWNVDGTETETVEYQGTESESHSHSRTENGSSSDSSTTSSNSEATNSRSAFNSDNFSPVDKTLGDVQGSSDSYGSSSRTESSTDTDSKSFTDRKDVRTLKRGGNIGVTTSQQMLTSEIDFRLKYDFENEFFKDIRTKLFELYY